MRCKMTYLQACPIGGPAHPSDHAAAAPYRSSRFCRRLLRSSMFLVLFGLTAAILQPTARADERKVEKRSAPAYPEMARKMHVASVVKITLTVAPDGSVVSAKAQSGNLMLVPAA